MKKMTAQESNAGWFGGTKRQEFLQFTRAAEELVGVNIIYGYTPAISKRAQKAIVSTVREWKLWRTPGSDLAELLHCINSVRLVVL